MPIPDFQSVMLPVLKSTVSGEVINKNDIVAQVSDEFGLTPEQKAELLPSGKQTIIKNRIGWAITYLQKAGLLQSPKRVHVQITGLGKSILAQNLEKINVKFLMQYESFKEFHTAKPNGKDADTENQSEESPDTPDEQLQQAYRSLNQSLAEELLDSVKNLSPQAFEQLVVDLMIGMGHGSTREKTSLQMGFDYAKAFFEYR